jgi:hypothetical protein
VKIRLLLVACFAMLAITIAPGIVTPQLASRAEATCSVPTFTAGNPLPAASLNTLGSNLANCYTPASSPALVNVTVIGDSIMQIVCGTAPCDPISNPANVTSGAMEDAPNVMATTLGANLQNLGSSGGWAALMTSTYVPQISLFANVVVINTGVNDVSGGRPNADFNALVAAIQARVPSAKLVFVLCRQYGAFSLASPSAAVNSWNANVQAVATSIGASAAVVDDATTAGWYGAHWPDNTHGDATAMSALGNAIASAITGLAPSTGGTGQFIANGITLTNGTKVVPPASRTLILNAGPSSDGFVRINEGTGLIGGLKVSDDRQNQLVITGNAIKFPLVNLSTINAEAPCSSGLSSCIYSPSNLTLGAPGYIFTGNSPITATQSVGNNLTFKVPCTTCQIVDTSAANAVIRQLDNSGNFTVGGTLGTSAATLSVVNPSGTVMSADNLNVTLKALTNLGNLQVGNPSSPTAMGTWNPTNGLTLTGGGLSVVANQGMTAGGFHVITGDGTNAQLYAATGGTLMESVNGAVIKSTSAFGVAVTGTQSATQSISAGSATQAAMTNGDLGASRSATTGAVHVGGSTSQTLLDWNVTNANRYTISQPTTIAGSLQAQSNGSTSGFVPPVYTAAGAALAGTTHMIVDTAAATGTGAAQNITITLTGAAIFAAAPKAAFMTCWAAGGAPFVSALYSQPNSTASSLLFQTVTPFLTNATAFTCGFTAFGA